jgi:hypothetical protein
MKKKSKLEQAVKNTEAAPSTLSPSTVAFMQHYQQQQQSHHQQSYNIPLLPATATDSIFNEMFVEYAGGQGDALNNSSSTSCAVSSTLSQNGSSNTTNDYEMMHESTNPCHSYEQQRFYHPVTISQSVPSSSGFQYMPSYNTNQNYTTTSMQLVTSNTHKPGLVSIQPAVKSVPRKVVAIKRKIKAANPPSNTNGKINEKKGTLILSLTEIIIELLVH